MEKVRKWQTSARQAKNRFLCVNCFTKPFGQTPGAQRSALCSKCYSQCAKEECYYCHIDFCFLATMKSWLKVTRHVTCIDCVETKLIHGPPGYCDTCKRQCAFNGTTCRRCRDGREKYGEPVRCEACNHYCAFLGHGDVNKCEGMSLCSVCTRKHKIDHKWQALKKDDEDDVEKDDGLTFKTDEDAYERYRQLQDIVAQKTTEILRKKNSFKHILDRTTGTTDDQEHRDKLAFELSRKRTNLQRKYIDLVQIESRMMQMDKRIKVDQEMERRTQHQTMYTLERSRIVLIVETSKMESENTAIEQELNREDQWPPPWHAEDEEIRRIEEAEKHRAMMESVPESPTHSNMEPIPDISPMMESVPESPTHSSMEPIPDISSPLRAKVSESSGLEASF